MGDVVSLIPDAPAALKDNFEFIVDCARFAEGIASEADVKKKYQFNDDVWAKLGEDDELVRKITDEKVRRIRNGSHKREKAQLLVVAAPDVAASIMNRADANDRHRLDAAKVLNDLAANPADSTPAAMDRFVIQINLGADTNGNPIIERFDKSIAINPNDGEPNDGSGARSMPLPAIDKRWDSDAVKSNDVVCGQPAGKKPVKTLVKTPIEREPMEALAHKTKTDSRSAYDIALASLMERG